jgi:hypothetical protein
MNVTEIVLAMMLANFKIEPSKEIGFEMIGISQPYVIGSKDRRHQLPVKLSLLQQCH